LTETAMLRTMQLFAHLQSNLVPLPGAQGAVNVYATQDSEHTTVSLIFINGTTQDQQVTVSAGGALPFFNPWQSTTVTLPGYSMLVLTLHRGGGDEVFRFSN